MVRGVVLVPMLALACVCSTTGSVLVPTYVLPPDSFLREQRSLISPPDTDPAESQRTVKRLMGGHMKIKTEKEYGNSKNSLVFEDKSTNKKYNSVVTPDMSGGNVGWNQGIWDDGMLMSSAGEGKSSVKTKDVDEDTKTLSDQVAEGKYGLIQNEIFEKSPKRPGIVSYAPNSETRSKDNLQTLGGLKKDEIWLAEDHLLVLKGGSFPESTKEAENTPWPPIDPYEAPRRQVKLPQKPKVPPPFPVQLTDNGPLVFLTPNGSVPASFFPSYFEGESEGSIPSPPFPFAQGAPNPSSDYKGNSTSGGASLPTPPLSFLPGNGSEGSYPFLPPINGSFPEGFPPGTALLPPPSNQSDLYDEDDPSIYYPPPYNFSYHADYKSNVPAGPLVPGIILPPPPDFFAPLEEKTTTTTEVIKTLRPITTRVRTTTKRPTATVPYRNRYKSRPTTTTTTTEFLRTEEPTTTTITPTKAEIVTMPNYGKSQRIVQIPTRNPINIENEEVEIITIPKTDKPVFKTRTKLTSKPLSVSVIYDYPDTKYDTKTEKPYIIYDVPKNTHNVNADDSVTSTPVPLRGYYSSTQNDIPTTKLEPVYNNRKPNDAVTSFYFYGEQSNSSPSPGYFDGRNYYKTVPASQAPIQQRPTGNTQTNINPAIDVAYGAIDQTDTLLLWPGKQGPRTVTQEYFSIQKPRTPLYVQQQPKHRPDSFYQQIADIQQTIDFFTTKRPKAYAHRPRVHKPKSISSRPIYNLDYQTKQRPDQYTFRAPKLDPEPFRPMVSYSKPFNLENEFNIITPSLSPGYNQQYLVESNAITTETGNRFYPKSNLKKEDYSELPTKKDNRPQQNLNLIPVQTDKPVPAYPVNRAPSTTPNPISHGYYTKQDERYIDDITKHSFDEFGKKIEDGTRDINGLAITPPLETVRTPIDNNININYAYEIIEPREPNPPTLEGDTDVNNRLPRPTINPDSEPIPQSHYREELIRPSHTLEDDTRVNDRLARPKINPDSEFIPIPNPDYRNAEYKAPKSQFAGEQDDLNSPTLLDDTRVNYIRPLPPVNPDAEWIAPVNTAGEGRPGSFVSYRLPGEGAHVYFLTPQASQSTRYRSPGYGR